MDKKEAKSIQKIISTFEFESNDYKDIMHFFLRELKTSIRLYE